MAVPDAASLRRLSCFSNTLVKLKLVGNKAKGRISKRVFQENKARQIFRKTNIFYPLIHKTKTMYKKVHKMKALRQSAVVLIRFIFDINK